MNSDEVIDAAVRKVPNFPKEGILFYDITSLLASPKAFCYTVDKTVALYKDKDFDAIAAVESRGFLFAAPVAVALKKPLVLIRKKGKLPGVVYRTSYTIEYGAAEVEVHREDVKKGARFLVIDDLVATGGSLGAARKLLQMGGAEVFEYFCVLGLPALGYEKALAPIKVTTLHDYSGE